MNRIEIRELQPGGPLELTGHAATFGQPYPVNSFEETIVRGAFKRTLGEQPDVSLLVNHSGTPLARTTSGTMTLSEDSTGLRFSAELEPSDPDVQAIVPKLRRGDLSECSFAFRATQQTWSDDKTERSIRECNIHRGDVSLVTTAANPNATAGLRAEDLTLEQRERVAERVGNRMCGPYSAMAHDLREAPRGRSQIVVPPFRYLETARARKSAARARGVRRVVRRSLVLSPFGPDWEIGSASDLHRAILQVEVGHARGPNEDAIKAWIAKRAGDLDTPEHAPAGWRNPAALAAYVEGHDPADTAPSMGGQQ
jgi:HK97 family phage prohead protease